jgi:hypothetical protein
LPFVSALPSPRGLPVCCPEVEVLPEGSDAVGDAGAGDGADGAEGADGEDGAEGAVGAGDPGAGADGTGVPGGPPGKPPGSPPLFVAHPATRQQMLNATVKRNISALLATSRRESRAAGRPAACRPCLRHAR